MRHLLESSCPGSPTKRLQDPEKTQVSGIYASWMQSDFLRDVTGQKVQGCSHGRFHSLDLHPWPHQTNPHLTKVKINQACCSQGQIIRAGTKCVYLLDFLLGGHVLMLMRAGLLLKRLQMQVQLKNLLSCMRQWALTLFARKGPILTYGAEVCSISLGSIPGVIWGLPRRRGAIGGCLCDPGWICYPRGAAVFFVKER